MVYWAETYSASREENMLASIDILSFWESDFQEQKIKTILHRNWIIFENY